MITTKLGLRGEFTLRVIDARTGNVRAERHFQNLITNVGLETFAKSQAPGLFYCSVGKGTNTPSVIDTALSNVVASQNMSDSGTTSPVAPNYEYSASRSCRFAAGAISDTITEIGIFYTNANTLWCRQLILDEYGNPSSLTVLPNEYLDVVYTLWYYPPLQDRAFQFQMNGVTYSCVSRCCYLPRFSNYMLSFVTLGSDFQFRAAYETQTLGDITSGPAGTEYSALKSSTNYTWGGNEAPYSWKATVSLGLGEANPPGGIGSAVIYHRASMPASQISFTPKLPKDSNTEMALLFSQTIGRYEP